MKVAVFSVGVMALFLGSGLWLMDSGERHGTSLPQIHHSAAVDVCDDTRQAFSVSLDSTYTAENKKLHSMILRFELLLERTSKQTGRVVGLARGIRIEKNGTSSTLPDMPFVTVAYPTTPAHFLDFDGLGLPSGHPMWSITQVLKNLSAPQSSEPVQFSYDGLGLTYVYEHKNDQWQRTVQTSSSNHSHQWSLTSEANCNVASMSSKESAELNIGPMPVTMTYQIDAKRLDTNEPIAHLSFAANQNQDDQFKLTQVNISALVDDIDSFDDMAQAFNDFAEDKDSGRLQRAAEYLVANSSSGELAKLMAGDAFSEAAKRDLAYGLSLAEGERVNGFLLDAINLLPKQDSAQMDVQKIRLLVALSGRHVDTRVEYDALMELNANEQEDLTVRGNALVSAATLVRRLHQDGHVDLRRELTRTLAAKLKTDQATDAMLAANNADIDTLDNMIVDKLTSPDSKQRYGAAQVLSRRVEHYDTLIDHLAKEQSMLTVRVILDGLDPEQLTAQQRQKLSDQALLTGDEDRRQLIQNFLAPTS